MYNVSHCSNVPCLERIFKFCFWNSIRIWSFGCLSWPYKIINFPWEHVEVDMVFGFNFSASAASVVASVPTRQRLSSLLIDLPYPRLCPGWLGGLSRCWSLLSHGSFLSFAWVVNSLFQKYVDWLSAAEFRKYCKRLHVDMYTKRKCLHAKYSHGGEGRRLCCGQTTWFCSVVGRQRLCFAHAAWQNPKQTLQFQWLLKYGMYVSSWQHVLWIINIYKSSITHYCWSVNSSFQWNHKIDDEIVWQLLTCVWPFSVATAYFYLLLKY